MGTHETREGLDHEHGPGCGHTAVGHDGHVDYLHDGHLHHPHEGHVDEHRVAIDETNPETCEPISAGHEPGHRHGPDCGHDAVPHGEHTDYLVEDHLHHPHEGHCDDHGPLKTA